MPYNVPPSNIYYHEQGHYKLLPNSFHHLPYYYPQQHQVYKNEAIQPIHTTYELTNGQNSLQNHYTHHELGVQTVQNTNHQYQHLQHHEQHDNYHHGHNNNNQQLIYQEQQVIQPINNHHLHNNQQIIQHNNHHQIHHNKHQQVTYQEQQTVLPINNHHVAGNNQQDVYQEQQNIQQVSNNYQQHQHPNEHQQHDVQHHIEQEQDHVDVYHEVVHSHDDHHEEHDVQVPIIKKHIYVHVPPGEDERPPPVRVPVAPAKKTYKIIFIKVPAQESTNYNELLRNVQSIHSKVEEKILVYVLVKKPEVPDIVIPTSPTVQTKPEVFYVKYKNNQKLDDIASQVNLGLATNQGVANNLQPGLVNGHDVKEGY